MTKIYYEGRIVATKVFEGKEDITEYYAVTNNLPLYQDIQGKVVILDFNTLIVEHEVDHMEVTNESNI